MALPVDYSKYPGANPDQWSDPYYIFNSADYALQNDPAEQYNNLTPTQQLSAAGQAMALSAKAGVPYVSTDWGSDAASGGFKPTYLGVDPAVVIAAGEAQIPTPTAVAAGVPWGYGPPQAGSPVPPGYSYAGGNNATQGAPAPAGGGDQSGAGGAPQYGGASPASPGQNPSTQGTMPNYGTLPTTSAQSPSGAALPSPPSVVGAASPSLPGLPAAGASGASAPNLPGLPGVRAAQASMPSVPGIGGIGSTVSAQTNAQNQAGASTAAGTQQSSTGYGGATAGTMIGSTGTSATQSVEGAAPWLGQAQAQTAGNYGQIYNEQAAGYGGLSANVVGMQQGIMNQANQLTDSQRAADQANIEQAYTQGGGSLSQQMTNAGFSDLSTKEQLGIGLTSAETASEVQANASQAGLKLGALNMFANPAVQYAAGIGQAGLQARGAALTGSAQQQAALQQQYGQMLPRTQTGLTQTQQQQQQQQQSLQNTAGGYQNVGQNASSGSGSAASASYSPQRPPTSPFQGAGGVSYAPPSTAGMVGSGTSPGSNPQYGAPSGGFAGAAPFVSGSQGAGFGSGAVGGYAAGYSGAPGTTDYGSSGGDFAGDTGTVANNNYAGQMGFGGLYGGNFAGSGYGSSGGGFGYPGG
jgi:hypothetical protein